MAANLSPLDYVVFAGYILAICAIGWWAGRKEKIDSADYFLAGRSLPWYVVGSSFIASNISSEHFIGMVGAACIYGVCVSLNEWRNVWTFSLLIWFFIPFLIASRAFTIPEFLEQRYNSTLRQFFAFVTILCNITAFLAAVLYGGGLALQELFGWPLWIAIVTLAVVAGSWAIYGGLRSVAWVDFFTTVVMVLGGIVMPVLGLLALSGESHSLVAGFRTMIERNQALAGPWQEAVELTRSRILPGAADYNRLSVLQPIAHPTHPWPFIVVGFLSVSVWYNVLNQFMIQRVLGARNAFHARMGIVLAGYLKILMPLLVVLPGLILFALHPDILTADWAKVKPAADKGYVRLAHELIPMGLRGLLLAALFGAIQSTVNSVLNSTATVFTLDIYKRLLRPAASEKRLVWMGVWSSVAILVLATALAVFLGKIEKSVSLFVYIQTMYAFFAPPFAAVFLLGILWRRINATGATVAVFLGFALGIAMKLYVLNAASPAPWIKPYEMQAITNWAFCVAVCSAVSLLTAPPSPAQVSDTTTINWRALNILDQLGGRWYASVPFWWGLFVLILLALLVMFSGAFL